MIEQGVLKRWWLLGLAIIGMLFWLPSCVAKGVMVTPLEPEVRAYQRVAVLPFHAAGSKGNIQTITTCQLSDRDIRCEQVASDIGMITATSMAREIAIYGLHQVVEPQQALTVIPDLGKIPVVEIGRRLHVEMLIFGTITRYLERVGGPYGVTRPASVGFEVFLVDAHSGKKVWSGTFYHTQQELSEDLTALGSFLQGGGKWLTAGELADVGIARLVQQLPGLKGKRIR
ncbi:MAG: hypothetical protein JXO49_04760 [Deltaproteobacteria bacterium]|nr:hypothetical protein [Candidatus Anaeroferrophillus wilburensis]MBN2888639.1 hypothetical protein [Deltaproteobacteria bacterium]